jgi:nucleotide-binding universal stress UspA family protein
MQWRSAHASIVCALSGGDRDRTLIAVGGALAARANRPLEVFHASEPVVLAEAGPAAPTIVVPAERDTRARIGAACDAAGRAPERCEIVSGPPVALLERLAQRPDIAALVVGDRGHGPLRAAVEGGLTRPLLTRAGCPLALLPRTAGPAAVEDAAAVVCAVDDDDAALTVAATGGALACDLGIRLLVVHAVRPERGIRARDPRAAAVGRLLDGCLALVPAATDAEGVAVVGPPVESVLEVAGEGAAAVVVVGAPSHGLLRSAVRGSVPHELIGRHDHGLTVVVPRAAAEAAPAGGR